MEKRIYEAIVVNLHDVKFAFVDNRDAAEFFSIDRSQTAFGSMLQITSRDGVARAIFAEVFDDTIEVPSQSP